LEISPPDISLLGNFTTGNFTIVTQKLTQGWLHALTVGLVELEKEI
jgi:hypothetical protein